MSFKNFTYSKEDLKRRIKVSGKLVNDFLRNVIFIVLTLISKEFKIPRMILTVSQSNIVAGEEL